MGLGTMIALNTQLNIRIPGASGAEPAVRRSQAERTLAEQVDSPKDPQNQPADTSKNEAPAKQELTPEQQRQIAELTQIDRRVREHEQAHLAVGRDLITSGPNYAYTYGPDGRQYATAGEVGIDTSPERKAEANIDKGLHIQATALAPRDPSPQDYNIAALGQQLAQQGQSQLIRERQEQSVAKDKAERAAAQGANPVRVRVENAYATTLASPARRINIFA